MGAGDDRFLASGDESGTAPEDRPFRPDVEGLRAVAVLLVVLFHSGIAWLGGGYVGVDVFFVISGFVITGVLMRERASTGRTSILAFYGRRCRRIIPAATLVIIVTVALSYFFLGNLAGSRTATDGRWATVFLANFHFSATGTNYLSAQLPPSPLQNYWSLSVEEQFYIVYPTLFVLLAGIRILSLRARLALGLSAVIVASFAFSIIDTANHATSAYFSPFTRAWELALGALVVVTTPWLRKVPIQVAATLTWLGLGAILIAAVTFNAQTAYPGSLVSLPVVGAALIIAGGARAPRWGVEALLHLAPFRVLGKLSYSLYLWHWPVLIIAADYAGKTSLTLPQNLAWDLVALAASAITYMLVENPIRHAKDLTRFPRASVGLGVALMAATLAAITLSSDVALGSGTASANTTTSAKTPSGSGASPQTVLRLVAASHKIRTAPANLKPSLAQLESNSESGLSRFSTGCTLGDKQKCLYGDRAGSHTMVLYGDSHAGMWFQALDDIATRTHWKLDVLVMASCPAVDLPTEEPGTRGHWALCDQWHTFAAKRIGQIDPDLLVISQNSFYVNPKGVYYTPAQWTRALEGLLSPITAKTKVVLGNLPGARSADCIGQHVNDVQRCSGPPSPPVGLYAKAERRAAAAEGARYINVTRWFCTKTCSVVIGNYDVYAVGNHVTESYSILLQGVLAEALGIRS